MADIIVGDQQPRRVYQVGTTPESVFTVPFPFLADADVHVVVNDGQADQPLTLGAGYTVSGAGNQSGTVTLTTPVKNCTVTVFRELLLERSTTFPAAGTIRIPALNREFDRLVMIDQQQQDELGRALKLAASDDLDTNATLPPAPQRAGRFFAFNGAGQPVMSDATVAQVEGVTIATWLDGHSVGDVTGYVGDGNRVRFPTGHNLVSKSSVLVVVGGVKQEPSAYAIDGGDIILSAPAPAGAPVDLRVMGITTEVQQGPRGDKGEKGDTGAKGDAGTSVVIKGSVATSADLPPTGNAMGDGYIVGANLWVWGGAAWSNVGAIKGPKGDTGSSAYEAWTAAGNTGTQADFLGALKGVKGDPGTAATVAVGTVTTGAPGSPAAVTNAGTPSSALLNITIPQGAKGDPGNAATVAVGSITTGAPGSSATVTNAGTAGAAVLNFVLPRGDKGEKGDPGALNVTSIAEAAALSASAVAAAKVVNVAGFYGSGDGGGGAFVWDAASSAAEVPGMVIKPPGHSGPGRLLRMLDGGAVNVRWFGARADWDHSAQTGTNDGTIFQAAIDFAAAHGLSVYIAPGWYCIWVSTTAGVASLTIPGGVRVFGNDDLNDRTALFHVGVEYWADPARLGPGNVGPMFDIYGRGCLENVGIYVYNSSFTNPVITRPTIRPFGSYAVIKNIRFHSPWIAIGSDVSVGAQGCYTAEGIFGFFHHRMFYLEDTADVSFIRRVHGQNPEGIAWPADRSWYRCKNGALVEISGADGVQGGNWFSVRARSLFMVSNHGDDPDNGDGSGFTLSTQISNIGCEDMIFPIDVQDTAMGPEAVFAFSNVSFATNNRTDVAEVAVINMTGNCHVRISNLSVGQSAGAAVVQQSAGTVRISNSLLDGMDATGSLPGNGSSLIKLISGGWGTVDFDGCTIRNFTKLVDDVGGRRSYGFGANCRMSGIASVGDLYGYTISSDSTARRTALSNGLSAPDVPGAVNQMIIQGGTSGNGPRVQASANRLNLGTSDTNGVSIFTGNSPANIQALFKHVANAVNYVAHYGGGTGVAVQLRAEGADPDIAMVTGSKGTGAGSYYGIDARGGRGLTVIGHNSIPANNCFVASHGTGNPPEIGVVGLDPNIDLRFVTKGTGVVRFGTWTAGSDAPVTGYITIKDDAGVVRKIPTIA